VVLLVGVHVDDLLMVGPRNKVDWLRKKMTDKFKCDDLGRPDRVLGVDITYHANGDILVHQTSYVDKLLFKFRLDDAQDRPTPMEAKLQFSKDDEPKTEKDKPRFPYRELVASLLYLVICTRPDLAFTVKELSRFLINPGHRMVQTAKRALRYAAKTKGLGLLYHRTCQSVLGGLFYARPESPVCAFSDAAFADQLSDRKSTAGMVLMFNGCSIMWWSKIIRTVACSSQDAEFMALSDSCREVCFIQNLLNSIGYHVTKSSLFGDNKGSLCLAKNPGDHQKSKHIEVRYFFIRQKVEEERVQVAYVKTTDQLADLLTKALDTKQHERLSLAVMGHSTSSFDTK
jgi:hypothetical protein